MTPYKRSEREDRGEEVATFVPGSSSAADYSRHQRTDSGLFQILLICIFGIAVFSFILVGFFKIDPVVSNIMISYLIGLL